MRAVSHRYLFLARIAVALVMGGGGLASQAGSARAAGAGSPPSLAEQLRYVGRDTATGMPAPVDDRFIAQVEHEISRYGKDAGEPVPPPPVSGTDVSWLTIPKLGVERAPVGRYGVDAYGRLDVPQDTEHVGWNPGYTALPGTGGATFFAAHFEYGGRPGVFYKLSTLAAGDAITVGLSDGSELRYRVTSNSDYALATIDMGALLQGREGAESITLMTCSGPIDPAADGYTLRTVVFAERVG
jgi:sortase (surface protein transpeptidase)